MSDQRDNFGTGNPQNIKGAYGQSPNYANGQYSSQNNSYNNYQNNGNYGYNANRNNAYQANNMNGGQQAYYQRNSAPNNNMGTPNQMPPLSDEYEIVKKKKHGKICSLLLSIGGAITFARNVVFNLIFLLLVFTLFGGFFAVQSFKDNFSPATQLNEKSLLAQVLYLNLSGAINEIPFSNNTIDRLQREIQFTLYGNQSHELTSIEKALYLVRSDKDIKKVIINIDDMAPITLSMAERIGKAMEAAKGNDSFRREVVVIGTMYSQAAYALAAHADRIVLDPLGEVGLRGIALTSLYFKDALDRFNITPYIFRAGHFKSAVEPFLYNNMSYDVRREYQAIAFKSWEIYTKSVNTRKAILNKKILPDANTYISWLDKFQGDRAQLQKAEGLVDDVMPIQEYLYSLTKELNVDADSPNLPAFVTYQDYLARQAIISGNEKGFLTNYTAPYNIDNLSNEAGQNNKSDFDSVSELTKDIERQANSFASQIYKKNRVAVIYGIGEIVDKGENMQAFTYENIAPLLNQAQHDSSVIATVLYLNSPGGSVIASEKIRRAVELYQKSGKPLIVSMNGTAASGAYWIASQADKIYATESTITGSIGVFGVGIGVHKLLNKYGAYQDGVYTNELALNNLAKEMPDSQMKMLTMSVRNTYDKFIDLVVKNRGLKKHDYEIFAEGQIFLAEEAKIIGLIDEIGTLDDAISFAIKQANKNPREVLVEHVSPSSSVELNGIESLFFSMSASTLPPELTNAFIEIKKGSELVSTMDTKRIMAISPVSEPKL